ncbi:AAA family ATPase [Gammaproteobacteria bacterium]|nr:AAA family ATPase [Gammaproteobacteria bacterium]
MVVATDTKASLLSWTDAGLRTNPFPSRGSESNYLKEFSQSDIFAIAEKLEPMQVFTGMSGVGKTVHARLLAKHLIKSQRRPTQLITASRTIKAMGLMKMICCRFNLDMPQTDVTDFQKIEQIRRSIVRRKEPVSLIIDDAQNLSNESLGALMRLTLFQQGSIKLQVVLLGLPITHDRSKKISQELQVEQVFSHSAIKPWDAAQTESYIMRRFEASGLQASKKVCRKICRQIHQLSGGVPMQINRRSNMMLGQLIQGHKKASPEQLKGSLLWGGALLSAITVGVFCYKATMTGQNIESNWSTEIAMLDGAAMVSADERIIAELDSIALAVDEEFDLYTIDAKEGVKEDTVAEQKENLVLATEAEEEVLDTWLEGEGYAVQVMATSAESEALNAADSYDTAHVEHVARKGQPTYVVLVGEYESIDDARSEVSRLSTENEKLQPWVRSYAKIRADIEALNE